jgi:adenylate cyclase
MTACGTCNVEFRPTAKFCDECGTAVSPVSKSAEYKQVTVLFADVVHSMDIATAVGPERLREIMTALVECSTGVVARYGGTVSQFTGDGLMASSGLHLLWRITPFARAWPRWGYRRRPKGSRQMYSAATRSACRFASA